jgi:hypothetical protein
MRRILLVMSAAVLMAAMVVASALPALAATTGDANQNPPLGSGGFRFQTDQAEENAPHAQNEIAATVLHCSGGPPGPTREGAIVTEGGTGGEQIGSSECQDPPRDEQGDKVGFLGGPPPP